MWEDLSASEKSELMRIFIKGGIRDLDTMRGMYNEYRRGGGIHIKPENRGKFTALKARTGKSASWFKAHGTPAQRKMATFALNARKWRHGEGGYLDDDEYFGGTLPEARKVEWLPEVQSPEGRAIASNMAERVASGKMDLGDVPRRYYNYVQGEAKGAIPMRGYMDKATNVALGTLAVPVAAMGAAELAPVLAPGAAVWQSPIVQQMVASEIGGRAVDLLSKDFTGKTWAENMTSPFENPGFIGQMAAEMTNPGYLLSPSHFISRVGINRLPQAAFDSYANRLAKEGFTPSASEVSAASNTEVPQAVTKPILKEATVTPSYEIEDLGGGYMLKSLMRGNPLEKQLSKQGTVNVNNVRSLINKGSDIEKTIVNKVLSSEEFANKKTIDYNKFRKAVQDELIIYDRTPNTKFSDYGIGRLGLSESKDLSFLHNIENFAQSDRFEVVGTDTIGQARLWKDKTTGNLLNWDDIVQQYLREHTGNPGKNTFTFSSSRIPHGSAKHYNENTLGHSRTYTTVDEPDILHVMESQSDWAQSGVTKYIKGDLAQSNDLIDTYNWRINILEQEINTGKDRWGLSLSDEAIFDKRQELSNVKSWLEKETERNSRLASTDSAQAQYLSDNYTTKQIQENLRYAAERGQTKMRYPTRETAAKIEGYPEKTVYIDKLGNETENYFEYSEELLSQVEEKKNNLAKEIDRISNNSTGSIGWISRYGGQPIWVTPEERSALIDMENEIDFMLKPERNLRADVTPVKKYEHENILKKYSDFPKQYKKLYKNADVRTVTDSKGNTWYEVDVPKDYLKKEWVYSTIPISIGAGAAVNNDKNSYANGGPMSGYNIFDILRIWNNSEDAQKNKIQSDSKILKKLASGIGSQEAVKNIGAVNTIRTFFSAPVGAIKGLLGKQNKYDDLDAYLYGPETVGMQEMTQTNGKDYSNYINENFPTRDIKSYSGTINPYNEYVFAEEDRHAIDSIINSGGNFYSNADAEYKHYQEVSDNRDTPKGTIEWKSMETPYRNDVGNYNMQIRKNKKGKYSISSSDLYDFSNNGKKQTIPQSLMGIVGNPYIIRQDNIPVRFIPLGDKINYKPMKYNDIDVDMDLTEEELRALNFHDILK